MVESIPFENAVGVWVGVENFDYGQIYVELVLNGDKSGTVSYGENDKNKNVYQITSATYSKNQLVLVYQVRGRSVEIELTLSNEVLTANYGISGGKLVLNKQAQ